MLGHYSPSHVKRGASGKKQGMREVKSGIFLSDPLQHEPQQVPVAARAKSYKVVRSKSGNLLQALVEEEGKDGDAGTTKVTSRFARVLLAGAGFLADAYDLFVINLVLRLLRNEYPEYDNNKFSEGGYNLHALEGGVAAAALVGAIVGQIVAGSLADVIGRKKIFVTTAILITIGSFGSACVGNSPTFTVYGQLAMWRFCLGAGVGGEYPLAATVTSESSSAARRGALMAGVFSMQGVGSLLSVLIVIICLSLGMSDAFTWRFALAFGALPVMIAFPFRRRMHETETFQRVAEERQTCSMKSRGGGGGGGAGGFGPFGGSGSSGADGGGFATADTPLSSQMHSNYGATYGSSDKSLSNDGTYNAQNILSEERYGAGPQKKNNIAGSKTKTSSGAATALAASENVDINGKRSSTGAWIGEGPGIKNLKQFRQERSKLLNPGTEERELEMQMVTDSVVQENAMFHLPGDYTPVDTGSSSESHNNNGGNIHHPHHHHAFKCETTHLGEIHRAFKYYKWHMLGTSLCWFLLDVDFYANGLFNHEITSSVFSTPGQSNTALQDAYYTLILSVIALPGYYLSVMYIDKVGRKNVQMLGFTMMGLLFLLCSLSYEWLMDEKGGSGRKYLFLLFYALTFLFSNFGPNTTSFVIPGEIFPAEVRATCHGVSAACGKLGAATGAYLFPLLLGPDGATNPTTAGIRCTMLICALVAGLGTLTTYLFIPTYDAEMLVEEGSYLQLDHAFLRPCDADLLLLDGYELVEVDEEEGGNGDNGNGKGQGAV